MTKLNTVNIAAALSISLQHECAPSHAEWTDVKTLHREMKRVSQIHNSMESRSFTAYPWEKKGGRLHYSTWTGRMGVEVGNDFMSITLYSPSFGDGNRPYFTLKIEGGSVTRTEVTRGAENLVLAKPSRLSHVLEYLIPTIGAENVFSAADPWTGQQIAQLGVSYAEHGLQFHAKNEDGYPEDFIAEKLEEATQQLQEFQRHLHTLQERDGNLLDLHFEDTSISGVYEWLVEKVYHGARY